MNKKVTFALVFRFAFVVISLLGVIFNTLGFQKDFRAISFLYYTTQSNLLAFILFSILFIKTLIAVIKDKSTKNTSFVPKLSFVLMIDIILTFLVFWALLAPGLVDTEYRLWSFSNLAVHTFTPLAVGFDYFMFNPKDKVKHTTVFKALIYPGIYAALALYAGAFKLIEFKPITEGLESSFFPYFFFDYYDIGWKVVPFITGIAAFLILVGYALYGFTKLRKRT